MGDAIRDAGCQPNTFQAPLDNELLIIKHIEFIRELGHFPIEGEIRVKAKNDREFPSHSTFLSRLGSKNERAKKIVEYCQGKSGFDDILEHCSKIIKEPSKAPEQINTNNDKIGYVYLIRHGKRHEYKIGRTNNPIRRGGEIRLELPEKIQPIHYIETDDPSGIESYWHSRFADKRK